MYDRSERAQINQKLKQETKDLIFNQQVEKLIEERKKQKQADAEGKRTYAEKVDQSLYTVTPYVKEPHRFQVEGDDKYFSKQWESMMKDCGFYYDNPSVEQEVQMKRTLQKKYSDDLFQNVMRPRLQSRKDLMLWACSQQNQFMDDMSAPASLKMNCEQY